MVQDFYTELCNGSKNVSALVRNSTAHPQTLRKKTPVVRAVAVIQLPDPPVQTGLTEASEEAHSYWIPKLTVKQSQEKLFEELDPSVLESWPPKLVVSAQSLLAEYHDIFSLEPSELGCTHSTEHVIKVTNDTLFKEQFRWIPLLLVEEVHMHLQEMLDSGAICPSQSVRCNAVVLVRKEDGDLCFCIDFWHLNAYTKKDSYPLPRIQEALESLAGAGHFSCLDLKSGFWQIKMDKSSEQYTAFTVDNLGFFECNWMPFGLCNAPATFQQLMQNCLGELKLIYFLIYPDDIVVFSHTAEEHLHQLHIIFDWFTEHNLKLKLLKCNFVKEEITHLAHWVSKEGVQPSNLKAITVCAPPQTYTEVCAFLGLVGHYMRFIKGFTQPLNEHFAGERASRKSEQVSLWEDALKAFEVLKQACMTTPVLAFNDYTKPFLLETGASKDRLGAVLLQKQQDGWYHTVTYGSRALKPHEKNYHLTKLEFLALKWVVTEHFKEYLPY